jgi:hypothetical protein
MSWRRNQVARAAHENCKGGAGTSAECARMVTEKFKALTDAQAAGAVALAQGKSMRTATKRAMAPVKRRVRANHRRLTGK